MKWSLILVVVAVGFLPGCSTPPKENYQQAIQSNHSQTYICLLTVKALDSGDTALTQQMLMAPVFMNLDSVRFYSNEGLVDLTPEERDEWVTLARQTLDYMLLHKDAWDQRRLDVQGGVRGLGYLLTAPEDVQRLNELSEYLDRVEENTSETHTP